MSLRDSSCVYFWRISEASCDCPVWGEKGKCQKLPARGQWGVLLGVTQNWWFFGLWCSWVATGSKHHLSDVWKDLQGQVSLHCFACFRWVTLSTLFNACPNHMYVGIKKKRYVDLAKKTASPNTCRIRRTSNKMGLFAASQLGLSCPKGWYCKDDTSVILL